MRRCKWTSVRAMPRQWRRCLTGWMKRAAWRASQCVTPAVVQVGRGWYLAGTPVYAFSL